MRGRIRAASRAALVHLTCGLVLAGLLAILIFLVWFPYPYHEISSGKHLFIILLVADIVCGPFLTLLLFDPAKERWKWGLDMLLILCLQLGALLYGLSNIAQSRPVFLAYEGDRFRVVYSADIHPERLNEALPQLSHLSWSGPRLIGVRLLESTDPEYLWSLRMALEGEPPSFRPERWVEYSAQKEQLLSALKPLEQLSFQHQSEFSLVDIEKDAGLPSAALGYLPLVQESMTDWIVVVGRDDGLPKAYWHIDGW